MATVVSPPARPPAAERRVPPLENGDRLTRAEFERRYSAMPHTQKAELIEGEVHMPSPVSYVGHGGPHADVMAWLGSYRASTPGVLCADNTTVRLDVDNEPQPDAFVMLDPAHGGQARVGPEGYVESAPELVVEVAASSVSIDLGKKMNAYRRNGVREYVVWRVEDQEIDWFVLREGAYEPLPLDAHGLYRSEVLPGLVLDPSVMVAGDLRKVIDTLESAPK